MLVVELLERHPLGLIVVVVSEVDVVALIVVVLPDAVVVCVVATVVLVPPCGMLVVDVEAPSFPERKSAAISISARTAK